jgi:hypothetical protein
MSLRLRPDLTTADTEYGTVLLDERDGRYWQLNPSAALVVRTLTQGGDRTDAAAALVDQFDVDRDRALSDVRCLLDELTSAGLLVGP